jgi:hypothetical protein
LAPMRDAGRAGAAVPPSRPPQERSHNIKGNLSRCKERKENLKCQGPEANGPCIPESMTKGISAPAVHQWEVR